MEREITKSKESEAQAANYYDSAFKLDAEKRKRAVEGKVVIRGAERPWVQNRQGLIKHFLSSVINDTALMNWRGFFIHDVRTHSGKHRHQGGLALYVIEGEGWTVVDGVRYEWEEGDLILLPLKPEGVEHQHFNAQPGKPCKWLALIYGGFWDAMGNQMEQKEESPDWSSHA